jgi:hypothetical protein
MLHLDAQEYFDRVEFDPTNGYEELNTRNQKIRHIQLHVAKAALKLIKRDDETIVSQVIPDTAIYRSQIINLLDESVRKGLVRELEAEDYSVTLIGKQDSWDVDVNASYDYFKDEIIKANGNLATYLERLEHGEPGDQDQLMYAALNLDSGTNGLAELYNVDIDQAHLARLEENMGQPLPADLT